MPSAVKQKVNANLWPSSHRRHSKSYTGSGYPTTEFQASPGSFDFLRNDKPKHQVSKTFHKSPVKHSNVAVSDRSEFAFPRRVSIDLLIQSGSEGSVGCGRKKNFELHNSYKSHSCPSFIPSDVYSLNSAVAPHPDEVPFPPLEWLQSPLKKEAFPGVGVVKLQCTDQKSFV